MRAHSDPFTRLDAWRAHDYCVRLLEYFGDAQGLVKANELRQEALLAYVDEQGIAPVLSRPRQPPVPTRGQSPSLLRRRPRMSPNWSRLTLRSTRESHQLNRASSWEPVPVGDVSVLDDLPKVAQSRRSAPSRWRSSRPKA